MEPDPRNRVPAPVPNAGRLQEIAEAIRGGSAEATDEFRRLFHPGVCFLIRRRVGHQKVELLVKGVLDTAVQKIRDDKSPNGNHLPRLVRQIIVQSVAADRNGTAGIDHLTPEEFRALRSRARSELSTRTQQTNIA